MNDETPEPFGIVGNEPVEARIVAWVLGESSAFEAAELERLCEERPELLVFRRRMRALHGLLTEAEAAEPDHSWKLAPEKRQALDDIFGQEKVVRLQPQRAQGSGRGWRRVVLSIAACLMLAICIFPFLPRKYESEAVVELKRRGTGMNPFGVRELDVADDRRSSKQFFGTEFEMIKSTHSLGKVVDNLNLTSRWKVDKPTAVRMLKDNVTAENMKGTDLISIRVLGDNPEEAKDLTAGVAKAYKEYRTEMEDRDAEKGLLELNKAVRDQEDKVEERRKLLATLVRTKKIIYTGQTSFNGKSVPQEYIQAVRDSQEAYNKLQQNKISLESQVNSLLKYEGEQLMVYGAALDVPDNNVKILYPKYREATRQLDDLKKNGSAENSPEVASTEQTVNAVKHQLDESIVSLRANLKSKLDMASDRLKSMEPLDSDPREDAFVERFGPQDYPDAKRDYEADQQLLQSMRLKQMGVMMAQKMTEDSVIVHEEPQAGRSTVAWLPSLGGSRSDGPAATPAKGNADSHRVESMAMAKNRDAGLQEVAKQKQLANRQLTASPARVAASGATSMPEIAAGKKMDSMPSAAAGAFAPGSASGGSSGFGLLPSQDAPVPSGASVDSLAKNERTLDSNASPARQPRPRVSRGLESQSRAGANLSTRLGDSQTPAEQGSSELALGDDSASAGSSDRPSATPGQAMKAKEAKAMAGGKDSDADNLKDLAKGGTTRGQDSLAEGDGLLNEGRAAHAKGDYQQALDKYRQALDRLPDGSTASDRYKSYVSHFSDASVALAMQDRKAGRYSEARTLLEGVLAHEAGNADAKREIAYLDDPIRTNPAPPAGDTSNENKVRLGLYAAEGNFNLGKYDEAKRAYEDVLRGDQYNLAARLGLEKVAAARSDYYRAAYDHTRAELLAQVEGASEFKAPDEKSADSPANAPTAPVTGADSFTLADPGTADADALNRLGMKGFLPSKDSQRYSMNLRSGSERTGIDIVGGAVFTPSDAGESEQYLALGVENRYDPHPELTRSTSGFDIYGEIARAGAADRDNAEGEQYILAGVEQRYDPHPELTRSISGYDALLDKHFTAGGERLVRQGAEVDRYTNPEEGKDDSELTKNVPPPPVVKTKPVVKDLADLTEEVPVAEDPYSTFSLNISDASFQLAKAALAKGERPDPASIKPEQFYNAVDYGDPAPASNEPVAATIEQAAHPVIPGRSLVRVALRTGATGRSAVQPLHLTLLVDQSGSMVREDRRAAMNHALAQLGVLLTKNDMVTVVGFSRTPHLLADGMTGDQAAKLPDLINQTANEGGTNLEEAMKLGAQMAERHQLAGAQNRVVLFTDGAANLGNADPDRLAQQVKALRQKGIAFDIAGIGADDLNDNLLSELARNGNGRYYVVGDEKDDSFARQLAGAFRPAAENVKVQVNFNPQRVGKYKLIGFEKDRLKTEDFRNDAVDAAELAAEETGIAIYQIEPLPSGTGEIGEVSVRFRDASSKEMVERTWTISYDSQATAFDRAAPSMQLAGLSMLAAEKLRGGPLADAIDFKQLSGPTSLVKQFYANSPRVGEMLRVIDQLK